MIELLDSSYNTINKLLQNYQVEKKIDTKIKIKCQFCKKEYNNYYSKTTIYNLPYYLILYLVKPIYNFKEYEIETNKICEKNNNEQYELISSIAYYGNYRNGHYIAKCKDIKNNQWYQFSDEKHNPINKQSIIDNNDIILFYKKK
jgi:ubiquitin C-terminal hydrolase